MEYIAKVTFTIRYVTSSEQDDETILNAQESDQTLRQAARAQLEDLFKYWAFADNPFIGQPGGSLESVVIEQAGKVREFKAAPPENTRYS